MRTFVMDEDTYNRLESIRHRLADESYNLSADERRDLAQRFLLVMDDIVEDQS